MIASKEEKVIRTTQKIIELFEKSNENSIQIDDYKELFKQYQQLAKRYKKIIKINDSMSSQVINKNESLEQDKQNIIKISREKILSNITGSRKLQEKFSIDLNEQKELVKRLMNDLSSFEKLEEQSNQKLKKAMETLKVAELKQNELKQKNKELQMKVKALKEFTTPFDVIVEKEIISAKRTNVSLALCMIGIDNFEQIKGKLDGFTTVENFILGILKYLRQSLKKTDVVGYLKNEIFYILILDEHIENVKKSLKTLGKRRVINQINISLSSGCSFLKENDETLALIQRCANAYKESINNATEASVIFY